MCKHHSHIHDTHTHACSLVHAIILCFARFVSFAFCVQSFPIVARLKRLCFVYLWQIEIVCGKRNAFVTPRIQHRLNNTKEISFSLSKRSNNGNGISSTIRRIYTTLSLLFESISKLDYSYFLNLPTHTHTQHTILTNTLFKRINCRSSFLNCISLNQHCSYIEYANT